MADVQVGVVEDAQQKAGCRGRHRGRYRLQLQYYAGKGP
jgi:hypothetical protein